MMGMVDWSGIKRKADLALATPFTRPCHRLDSRATLCRKNG